MARPRSAAALAAFDGDLWSVCQAVLRAGGHGADGASAAQADWVRRAVQFADRDFGRDARAMGHCLQDVHNERVWRDLVAGYVEVDYTAAAGDARVVYFARETE